VDGYLIRFRSASTVSAVPLQQAVSTQVYTVCCTAFWDQKDSSNARSPLRKSPSATLNRGAKQISTEQALSHSLERPIPNIVPITSPSKAEAFGTDVRSVSVGPAMSHTVPSHTHSKQTIEALRSLLDRGRFDQVVNEGRELLAAPAMDPSDLATIHVLIGRAEMMNGRIAPALQRFRLVDYGELAPSDRLRLGIFEALSRYGSGGVPAVIEVIDELDANANGDEMTLAAIAGLRAWTYLEANNGLRAVELATESNVRARRHTDDDLTVLSWLILGFTLSATGQVEQAGRAVASGLEHATITSHTAALPVLHMLAADIDLGRGRLQHATYHARLAIESSEPISAGVVGLWGNAMLGILCNRQDRNEEAQQYVVSAERALLRGAPIGLGHLAVARLRLDRESSAESAAQRLLDVWDYLEDKKAYGYLQFFSLPAAELLSRLTNPAMTSLLRKKLNFSYPSNPVDHFCRDLACALVDGDTTLAISIVESIDKARPTHTLVIADCMTLVADLLAKQNDKRSRSFAESARAIYEEIGADGDLRRLVQRHPSISRDTEVVLSPAERRVVSLVVDGLSNVDIAEQLFLSVKTVETHLARVYRRFGVKSRTQLVSALRNQTN
jgi:DNA-binding CsgD family transcriptional regulator